MRSIFTNHSHFFLIFFTLLQPKCLLVSSHFRLLLIQLRNQCILPLYHVLLLFPVFYKNKLKRKIKTYEQRIVSSQFAFVLLIAYIGSRYLIVKLMLCLSFANFYKSLFMKGAISTFFLLPLSSLISSLIPSFSLILCLSSVIKPSSAPSAITTTQ